MTISSVIGIFYLFFMNLAVDNTIYEDIPEGALPVCDFIYHTANIVGVFYMCFNLRTGIIICVCDIIFKRAANFIWVHTK